MTKKLILVVTVLIVAGCVTSPAVRREKADELAVAAGFRKTVIKTDPFILTAYYHIATPGRPVSIYIEGDGYAWVTSTRVSGDPTPRDPLVLQLASQDPAENVVYLARPCQYSNNDSECRSFYWTTGRFAEEVVRSTDQAISQFADKANAPGIHLVGYSGGAAVAVLTAARRNDVLSLRTVAGNLDPELVNEYHGATPLTGSLDPMDAAEKTALIPQIHFIGKEDKIIPVAAAESFMEKAGNKTCIQIVPVANTSHQSGWVEAWKGLAELSAVCR